MDALNLPRRRVSTRIRPSALARGPKVAVWFVVGWTRWSYDQFVVLAAARFLPRSVAMALAGAAGWVEAFLPIESRRVARAEVTACGARGWWGVTRASAKRLAMPHRNLALVKRMWAGKEHPRDWNITHVNGDEVFRWLAEKRPFIITSGHFIDASSQVRAVFLPVETAAVSNSVPGRSWSPRLMRRRQERLLTQGLRRYVLTTGGSDADRIRHADLGNSISDMVERLSRPGFVQTILFDAVWEKPSGFVRPFAGEAERRFAIGIARLSRLAQAPIVHYVPYLTANGEARVEWGPYIEPLPQEASFDAEVAVVDQLADTLEAAIARYWDQYHHPIGWERRWNEAASRWE